MKCFECQMQHPNHKISCDSVIRMKALVWMLESLHFLPDELLEQVHGKVMNELLERKFGNMFDEEEGEQ